MTTKEAYNVLQEASDIKKGDRVKVLRKATNFEVGWSSTWTNEMDGCVGRAGTVADVRNGSIAVIFGNSVWWFPFFVLERLGTRRITKKRASEILSDHFGESIEIVED